MLRTVTTCVMVAMLGAAFCGCGAMRGWTGERGGADASAESSPASMPTDVETARAALRDVVADYVKDAESSADADKSRVERKRPYFVKEYADYPADALDVMVLEIQETESRTAPFRAEVSLPKTRYTTRLHRERSAAMADSDFVRQTGRETLNLAMRSGRWHMLGAAFVADRTETAAGGEWQEVEEIGATAETADSGGKGWFSRQWSRMFGN